MVRSGWFLLKQVSRIMQSSWIRIIAFLILSYLLAGCSGKGGAKVSGSVLLDGQPLADAQVRFDPKDDSTLGVHVATTDSEGKFTLKGDRNIPIKPGPYVVTVNKMVVQEDTQKGGPPGKGPRVDMAPTAYRTRDRTPLKADIQPGDNTLPPFELKGSKKG